MQIGEVASFQNGYAFKSKDFVQDGKYKIIKIKELKDGKVRFFNDSASVNVDDERIIEKYIAEKGDVLFALTGDPVNKNNPLSWVGRVSVYEDDQLALLNQRVCKLVPKEGLNAKYIYYYFRVFDNFYALASIAKGSASQANISTKDIEAMEIALPSLNIQNKIVSVLDSIEEKINQNNKINDNLEQQIQELYKEWFITNREDNWQRIPLSDIIFFQEGPGIRNWQYVEDGVKFINIRCINNGLIDTSTANKISLEEASGKYSHFMLEPYDIVMSCSGTLGRYAIVLPQNLPLCLNTSVIRFRPKQYKDDYSFVYGYMTSKEFLNQQITMANGSAQVNFGPTHLKKIEIVEPPVETRKKFNDLVFPLIETQISLRAENTRLVEIRDTLLPRLMSGEIDVSEVEI